MKSGYSHLETVPEVLNLVKGSGMALDADNDTARGARAAIPNTRPHAQLFMAWELYYQRKGARLRVLRAMDGR